MVENHDFAYDRRATQRACPLIPTISQTVCIKIRTAGQGSGHIQALFTPSTTHAIHLGLAVNWRLWSM